MFYDKVFSHIITHWFVLEFSALFNVHKRQGPEESSGCVEDNTFRGFFLMMIIIIIFSSNGIT